MTLQLQGTSIEDAKALTPLFGDAKAELSQGEVRVQVPPRSLSIYKVQ